MARLVKNKSRWHRITIKGRYPREELILMGGPKSLQLSIWCDHGAIGRGGFAWFRGQKALRALAKEILNPKPRRRALTSTPEPK